MLLVKKVIVLKINQEIQGMIIMQLKLNLSTFLFLLFLVPLLWIPSIAGWQIVGLLDISLVIEKSSQTWLRESLI